MEYRQRLSAADRAAYGRAAQMTQPYQLKEQLSEVAAGLQASGAPAALLQPIQNAHAELEKAHEAWLAFEAERSLVTGRG